MREMKTNKKAELKTYVVDWGPDCNGGRYGLIQATSMNEAIWDLDAIVGYPDSIAPLEIPESDGIRYTEIDPPTKAYSGSHLIELFLT
jgi:hypothetical protein